MMKFVATVGMGKPRVLKAATVPFGEEFSEWMVRSDDVQAVFGEIFGPDDKADEIVRRALATFMIIRTPEQERILREQVPELRMAAPISL